MTFRQLCRQQAILIAAYTAVVLWGIGWYLVLEVFIKFVGSFVVR